MAVTGSSFCDPSVRLALTSTGVVKGRSIKSVNKRKKEALLDISGRARLAAAK